MKLISFVVSDDQAEEIQDILGEGAFWEVTLLLLNDDIHQAVEIPVIVHEIRELD